MRKQRLYDVRLVEVGTRYVGETPVECAVFHKTDGTTVVVRLTSAQMAGLARQLDNHIADEGKPWP